MGEQISYYGKTKNISPVYSAKWFAKDCDGTIFVSPYMAFVKDGNEFPTTVKVLELTKTSFVEPTAL